MEKFKEYFIVYTIGAIGYGIIEVLFRGYTHWSMLIAGGICFMLLYLLNDKLGRGRIFFKSVCGAIIITGVELAVGLVVNKLLKLNVWDYSDLRFNLFGQVSLLFTVLWFLLCMPVMLLSRFLKNGFERMRRQERRTMAVE